MRKTSDIIWQDAQHQVLFETLDLIKSPGVEQTPVLFRLRDYTESHFSLEERYMVELGFPGCHEHTQAHDCFRLEVSQLLAGGAEPDVEFREIIATFLTTWLTRHVFGIDKELEAFILQSNAK
jgi:hemerythrin